jgi:hypothetical protein
MTVELNKIWSVLAQGELYIGLTARKMDETWYDGDIKYMEIYNCLFGGLDPLQKQFHIEQYVQLIHSSILKDYAESIDPINTYNKSKLIFPEAGFFDNAPDPISVTVSKGTNPTNYNHTVSVDVSAPSVTIDGGDVQNITYTGNLSSYIDLPNGDRIRLSGTMPGADYSFQIENRVELRVDYRKRLALLQGKEPLPWENADLRNVYINEISWVDRLAAVLLQVYEANLRT